MQTMHVLMCHHKPRVHHHVRRCNTTVYARITEYHEASGVVALYAALHSAALAVLSTSVVQNTSRNYDALHARLSL